MRRARELRKTLLQVYRAAKVNKAYLSDVPKTGWHPNKKLEAIATELDWTVDQLLYGDEDDRQTTGTGELFEMAVNIAADLLMHAGGRSAPAPTVGRLSRLIHDVLRELAAGGRQIDRESVMIWGRHLIAALRTDSTASG